VAKKIYFVEASYPGGIKPDVDDKLVRVVGRLSDGSGCLLFGNHERDLSWEFAKKADAEKAASKLRMAEVKDLKVFWDSYDD
jgi:hypothetical protein